MSSCLGSLAGLFCWAARGDAGRGIARTRKRAEDKQKTEETLSQPLGQRIVISKLVSFSGASFQAPKEKRPGATELPPIKATFIVRRKDPVRRER
jgi:hypothetical protein